ncbi:MAG: L,D-transpeptidase/peptidoglycan binding protein [Lachnospiraceae bacterium]|nr:L,D-transpeptidase/peptidoglycan binding protein [Lachnospiraceae bacterium]
MKRLLKHLLIILCIILVSLMGTYIGLAIYYHNAFAYGTWINGVYCTGRSIQDVNDELVPGFAYEGLTVYDVDGNSYFISAEEIGYQFDFMKALEVYQKQQNPWMWIESLFYGDSVNLIPIVSYDGQALDDVLDQMPFMLTAREQPEEERRVAIIKTKQGYELINERQDVLSADEAAEAVIRAIEQSEKEISLEKEGCYHDLALTSQMQDTLGMWEQVKRFQECGIVYQIGEEQIAIDGSVVCEWIELAEDGSFAMDDNGHLKMREDAIEEFVDTLAAQYDTVGGSRQFRATRGELVTVEGGTYGNKIDREAEVAYLTEAFMNHRKEVHEPEYIQTALQQGKDDIGDTYVEVDMGEQMMYYYVKGVQQIATPIVTGNTSRKMGTPAGVNYVYLKQTNRILRGPGYASHVDYWMPVKGNIGIHDAAWRSRFGGTIYQTNGSHGCINTPRETMVQLYESVEVGTPVVMFY